MGFELEELIKTQLAQESKITSDRHRPQSNGSSGDIEKVYANVFGSAVKSESSDRTAEEVDDALQPVTVPAPKPKSHKKATAVQTDRAPTVDEVLDPRRPSLDGASHDVVLESIERLVTDIYQTVLYSRLEMLQTALAKTKPPPETPFALTLLGWVVETIATWTVTSIGKIAAKELFGHAPAIAMPQQEPTPVDIAMGTNRLNTGPSATAPSGPTPGEVAVGSTAASVGAMAGGALKREITKPRPTTEPAPADVPLTAAPGQTLLVEFITRQKDKLLAKKHDAITTLALIRASAAGKAGSDFVALDIKLRNLIATPDLSNWFHHKVTMEWLNFLARISLGPRASGQSTDMIGANMIDGIASAGTKGRSQWTSSEGFVEITLTTPDRIDGIRGLAVQSARIPSSYGSTLTLKDADRDVDGTGQPYNLATLPVYRRVWLQTGSSKLTTSPAFVITPDGYIEADVANPVLAAIGSGRPVAVGEAAYLVGGAHFTDEERKDPNAWSRRALTSSQATVGAHLVREMLRRERPGSLQ